MLRAMLGMMVVALASLGCGPSAEKLEAQRVLREVDAVRDGAGPAAGRLELLKKLEADGAQGKLAAATRDACATAYRPLFEATAAMEEVKRAQADGSVGPEVFDALRQAEAALESSKSAMPACESAHADLSRASR
jgi:hypothetical protein